MVFSIPFNHDEIPDWNFEKHCTQIKPEILSTKDLDYSFDTFGITKPFRILTDEAIEICRHIVLHDENIKEYCMFSMSDKSYKNAIHNHYNKTSHQSKNTYAIRNFSAVSKFFHQMFSCKNFENYLSEISGEEIHLWPLEWEKSSY